MKIHFLVLFFLWVMP